MSSASPSRPLVTVIVPTYNYGHFIGDALHSVRSQTYSDWECIVVDDGSTDDTAAIVGRLAAEDARIRYFRQENARQAAARNKGISLARGDYFQFLDADDLIESRKLEQQVAFLEEHADVDITYSSARYFSEGKTDERLLSRQYSSWEDAGAWMPEIGGSGRDLLFALLRNNIMVVNSPLIRRQVINEVGLFDVDLTPVEDWEYLIRCAAKGVTFSFDDFADARALVRAHGLSSSLNQPRYLRAVLRLRRKVATIGLDADARALNGLKIAEVEGHIGIEEVVHGRVVAGIFQICKASFDDPRLRFKAKWLICAACAPFISGDRLKRMVTSSLTGSLSNVGPSLT
jgi:glycosyltransferase involved in cell wall biosynthesis